MTGSKGLEIVEEVRRRGAGGWQLATRRREAVPAHADQALPKCFGAADEYVNGNNRRSNGLRNPGISGACSPKPGHSAWSGTPRGSRMALHGSRSGWGGVFCLLNEGVQKNMCFRFGGTKMLNVRNTKPI